MTLHQAPLPSYAEMAATAAVFHVRHAGRHLTEAQFRLDESGHACAVLDHLAADTFALVADWSGRPWPSPNKDAKFASFAEVPAWIAKAAVEWRAERDRRARR